MCLLSRSLARHRIWSETDNQLRKVNGIVSGVLGSRVRYGNASSTDCFAVFFLVPGTRALEIIISNVS